MSSVARPPEPCLIAVILIVRSRAGPRFVFHYPPNPYSDRSLASSRTKSRGARSNDSASSRGSESSSSSEDEEGELENLINSAQTNSDNNNNNAGSPANNSTHGNNTANTGTGHNNTNVDDNASITTASIGGVIAGEAAASQRPASLNSARSNKKRATATVTSDIEDGSSLHDTKGRDKGSAPRALPWDSVLGLPPVVWEKLLSPARTWHKRRFEVGINDLAFVGWPVFVRDDGTWRKQKRKKTKNSTTWAGGELGHEDRHGEYPAEGGETAQKDESHESGEQSDTTTNGASDTKTDRKLLESPDPDKDAMTMFNVVFVLDPPLLEYSLHVKEMYDNIIKKFSKALKWEQARTDYVWREAQKILQMKEHARGRKASVNAMYSELINNSSLARAIYTIYSGISNSKIASVTLSPEVSVSLQIPPLTSISQLPMSNDTSYAGLWLTTADTLSPADETPSRAIESPHQIMAKHFALLLLDNEATILKDVEASGGALGPALAHYIRCSKPNKSFAQISASSGISLENIQLLASHLVYWRRARTIPPLHQRDTYIVSPNCDLSKLSAATVAYASAFPTSPSLPKMLSMLSGTPRPYYTLIPSKDHKETYFAILSWLLRGGWVTQLRSFARVRVTPEIKLAVERRVRREELEKYLSSSRRPSGSSDENTKGESVVDDDDHQAEHRTSSSSLKSYESGDHTPVPGVRDANDQYGMSDSYLKRNVSLSKASLILFPHRASPLESLWLDEITSRFADEFLTSTELGLKAPSKSSTANNGSLKDANSEITLKKWWSRFVKYFNGHDALEKIAVREGLKRSVTWQILLRMGVASAMFPGSEDDIQEQVLVVARHW